MRVTVVAIGHRMPAWVEQGVNEYVRRMPPEVRVELVELKPGRDKTDEGRRMLEAFPKDATVFALDERGTELATRGWADMLSGWMREGVNPVLAIGGADGLAEEVKRRAKKMISLSALTLPHQLVRVVLAEQLYRAWTVLMRHPYHRE
ncbi:MAG TPA: 23S rRNA (pseudouridine(1915)-N(3))-methyltransferase RlmH [Usitatibacter sp.]|nr:23S rRNA (pseudouridine(1915)-N(3))-methyltransferase RlmH [Usitatibacter sp.]